jgi:phosphoglycerate dehydrogenase-like enzyme
MTKKVLITPRSLTKDGHPSFDMLRKKGCEVVFCTPGKQPDEEELVRLLPGCVGYLAGVEKVSARALEAAKDLKVISRNGTGIDNVDLASAERLKIKVCRTEGANARGVAELTVGLLLGLVRHVAYHDAKMKAKQWERRKGLEVENRTLGLVGCGKIGEEVARMALGLGMKVIAYRRSPDLSFAPSPKFKWVSMEELLKTSDVVSLHRPGSPGGEAVIDGAAISNMKKGVFIVNTARASLLDEAAVLEGLASGRIGGVAVDVYAEEPPKKHDLVQHERVIATPHLGGFTDESVDRATTEAVENLIANM